MIATVLLTVLLEAGVILAYCRWQGRPAASILGVSLPANLLTQAFLWSMLCHFWRSYLLTLLLCELVIWGCESLILWVLPSHRLGLREATRLSLCMNATSFGVGWFLPF